MSRAAVSAVATALAVVVAAVAAEPPARLRSTVERLAPERLAAAHARVDHLRGAVTPADPIAGLRDYRAIFHAHAGDAAHTAGTPEELLADAVRVGVDVVFLSDHYRPPRDFMESWRGVRQGVLFVPGSEAHGFLIHPDVSVASLMDGPEPDLIAGVEAGTGMAFLSHVEERADHPMTGVTGMEIYNRHADAKDDAESMRVLVDWMTEPEGAARLADSLGRYPEEVFAAQLDYPGLYLAKWDRETAVRRVVGVAANDCHHNQVFVVKKVDDTHVRIGTVVDADAEMTVLGVDRQLGIADLVRDHAPGEVVGRFDFDPYWVAMRNTSTHVLAPRLEEAAIRAAVAAGHVYVAHDWMADPTGFTFSLEVEGTGERVVMGDGVELSRAGAAALVARFPYECRIRLLRGGTEVLSMEGSSLRYVLQEPGVYRVEGWLSVDEEWRSWVYSNPIYVDLIESLPVQ
ncbi:MAG: histidinol phosphatase [Acidobacteriota bacterium]|nr:histidinol phosphatase [Acidobacteriota bacterium]